MKGIVILTPCANKAGSRVLGDVKSLHSHFLSIHPSIHPLIMLIPFFSALPKSKKTLILLGALIAKSIYRAAEVFSFGKGVYRR